MSNQKLSWTKQERELVDRMAKLSDENFFTFYNKFYKKYRLKFDLMEPPYVADETLMGAIAVLTKVPYKKIVAELTRIEKKSYRSKDKKNR